MYFCTLPHGCSHVHEQYFVLVGVVQLNQKSLLLPAVVAAVYVHQIAPLSPAVAGFDVADVH